MTKLSECEIAPAITSEWAKQLFVECVTAGEKCVPSENWLNADLKNLHVTLVFGRQILMTGVMRQYYDFDFSRDPHGIERIPLHMIFDPLNKEVHYIGYSEYENTIFVWQKDVDDGSQV